MTATKLFWVSAAAALAICAVPSCSNGKSDKETQEHQNFVRNESDQTAEDAEKSAPEAVSETAEKNIRKDSATVGPVAPKAPPRGGRADQR